MTTRTYAGLALEVGDDQGNGRRIRIARGVCWRPTISEWARDVLLQATMRRSIEEALLAEVLALRTIVLNLHFALATGLTPNADAMQGLIDRADREKVRKAQERLVAIGDGVYRQESQ